MCRHGTREDCPVAKCRFQHSTSTYIIYSSGLKGAAPPPPTPATSPTRSHFPPTDQSTHGWYGDGKVHAKHIRPSVENAGSTQGRHDLNGSANTPPGTFDANALAQGRYFLSTRGSIRPRYEVYGQQLIECYCSNRRTRDLSCLARKPSRSAES